LREVASAGRRFGYWRIGLLLDRRGMLMNPKSRIGFTARKGCRSGWQHVGEKDGVARIACKRAKAFAAADLPILPEMAKGRLLPTTQDAPPVGYKPETLGNWFRGLCAKAEVPGLLHGLRKAGATRLGDAGGSHGRIASFLAH